MHSTPTLVDLLCGTLAPLMTARTVPVSGLGGPVRTSRLPRAPESSKGVNRLFPQACVNPASFPRLFG